MLQKFIDNTFYYLFVFALVFGVVFYDTTRYFGFVDEICAIVLCALYGYYVFHTPNWSVNKLFLVTLGVFFFYLVYSLAIQCNSKAGIVTDFIIQIKPYLAFFTIYAFKPVLNETMKRNIRLLAIVFSVYLLGIGLTTLFTSKILDALIMHESRLATAATIVACMYLYCSEYKAKDKLVFVLLLSIGLFSGRSKMYGLFVLAIFMVSYINQHFELKFNRKNAILFTIMSVAVLIVAWNKINFYFIQGGIGNPRDASDYYARAALYYFSMDVFTEYFPFGSGFATYATFASGQYYSHIYDDYGMNILYGLTKSAPSFIADTYYPALAQFGVVGVVLFFAFWGKLVGITFRHFTKENLKDFTISILIILFFLIECTSDSTITHNRGLFMMMLLALSLNSLKASYNKSLK